MAHLVLFGHHCLVPLAVGLWYSVLLQKYCVVLKMRSVAPAWAKKVGQLRARTQKGSHSVARAAMYKGLPRSTHKETCKCDGRVLTCPAAWCGHCSCPQAQ